MPRPHLYLLAALLAAFGISHFSDSIDPYHLDVIIGIGINIILAVSLNLVNGQKLAWQQRKAESFTVTPLHSGSFYVGYRDSKECSSSSMSSS